MPHTPHQDLDHLPLAEKYFRVKDTSVHESQLKLQCRYRVQYLNNVDKIALWESNFPKYEFSRVHVFLEIVHYCHMNYNPSQRTVMTPDHTVLFTIATESINEMLQLQPRQNLTPISIENLLDKFPRITSIKLAQLFLTFIMDEKYIPKDPTPYMWTIFSKPG